MPKFRRGDQVKTITSAGLLAHIPPGSKAVVAQDRGHDWYDVDILGYGVYLLRDYDFELESSLPLGIDSTWWIDDTAPLRPKCECGQSDQDWVIHSDWCNLGKYLKNVSE